MKVNKTPLLTAILLTGFLTVAAQNFRTERLRKAATVCGLQLQNDTLRPCQVTALKAKDGLMVVVRTDSAKTVEHIGIPLFNDDMRLLMPSPVYDFLEYAVLNKHYTITPNQLHLQKVVFRSGGWDTLVKGQLNLLECAISNEDDRYYVVSWQREGREVACVGVPIDYELLGNDTRRNMERDFVRLLEQTPQPTLPDLPPIISEDELKVYGTGGLFVKEGESYMLVELNQNVYYTLQTIREQVDTVIRNVPQIMTLEDVMPMVLVDTEFPNETLSNLMMAEDGAVADVLMQLDFHLSNYHRHQVCMPLSQLRAFLRAEGCKLYFANSGAKDDKVQGVLFVTNAARGYNHLFCVEMPLSQITAKQPQAKVDVYLYIPTIDKSHLYGKLPEKKSGTKFKH